jgi:plastocyanin
VIRGIVRVSPLRTSHSASLNAYPGRADAIPVAPEARGSVTDAVVYVEGLPASVHVASSDEAVPQLAQKGQQFVPRVLAVAQGTAVEFPNMDPIFHNVFSLSPVKRFDLGRYPRGQSRRVVFTKPGLVNVFCDIHSSMAAYVLVLPHHAFTQPDADGAFRLPDLPAGRYVLHVWHPDFDEITRPVEVPATGDVAVEVGL